MALTGVFLVGNILCAVAASYWMLLIGRIIIALVAGTIVSMSMTYAADVTAPRNRTKFIAWVFSGFSIASVVGVPVGTWVAGIFGWRYAFYLVTALTILLMVTMAAVLPRGGELVKVGIVSQFRLFLDRRIQLGLAAVICGAAASYAFYTYLSPILRDEIGVPEQYISIGLVLYGVACLCSNLYSGKLAGQERGMKPLYRIRFMYYIHAVLLCTLAFAGIVPVYGAIVLIVLGFFMYLQNSSSQVLYMDVAAQSHPGSTNLAASLNSMAFNIGIAVGSAAGGVVNDTCGLTWLGPAGAVFALLAGLSVAAMRPYVAAKGQKA